jgi:hypothetical protein
MALVLVLTACENGVDVLTGLNNPARTGVNLNETVLTRQLLRTGRFGKLFTYEVDGAVYAQPLLVSGLDTQDGKRNVLVVATTKNKLYAFDAEHYVPSPIWQLDLTGTGTLAETEGRAHLAPSVGILSTPVIDRTANALYVVSRSFENARHVQRLHRVVLSTGAVQSSIAIDSSIAVNGHHFDAEIQINRPGLSLANGLVIILWGSFLDEADRGWVTAFDKESLALRGVFCTTCYASAAIGGMIWQSGRPPAVDGDRYLYFFTGNGWDSKSHSHQNPALACDPSQHPPKPPSYFGESLVKLDLQNVAGWKDNQVAASWTPSDWCELDHNDADLGSSGPMLITAATADTPSIAVGGGKAGVLYSIDTAKIAGPNFVEWQQSVSPSAGAVGKEAGYRINHYGAINECVDFEERRLASSAHPPYGSYLVGTTIDVPAKYPHPWAVTVGPVTGGEHTSDINTTIRPLCAPIDAALGWGKKHDGFPHHIMGGAVFLPTSPQTNTGRLFLAPENLPLLAFDVSSGRIKAGPFITLPDLARFPFANFITSGHPGGMLAVSADGPLLDAGVVWVSHYRDLGKGEDATRAIKEGVLEAFDAGNLSLLWSSDGDSKDWVGYFQKFTPPTVGNGKVYLAASPSPAWDHGCISPTIVGEYDPCFSYDTAGSDGKIVVYGELPRRWLGLTARGAAIAK